MARNDMSHISAIDKAANAGKWVVFKSKEWGILPPVSVILASHHSLSGCYQSVAVQTALTSLLIGEVLVNHFIDADPLISQYP